MLLNTQGFPSFAGVFPPQPRTVTGLEIGMRTNGAGWRCAIYNREEHHNETLRISASAHLSVRQPINGNVDVMYGMIPLRGFGRKGLEVAEVG